jgi:hypothetical protein
MFGWIEQMYENDPAVWNVLVNEPPGAIVPESQLPAEVDVWAMVSSFVHVTLPPTATLIGFGEYAVVVNPMAPRTIDAIVVEPDGVGLGLGLGVGAGAGE